MANTARSALLIDCPIGTAFQTVSDPLTYPLWLVGAQKILAVDHDWPAPGSTFRHIVGESFLRTSDMTRCLAVQPPTMLLLSVRARPFLKRATVRFELESDADADRTCVTLIETPDGWTQLFAPVMVPLLRFRNDRSLRQLDQLVKDNRAETATRRGDTPGGT